MHTNVCRIPVCSDQKLRRAQTPLPGERKGGTLLSNKAGITAMCSCLHRDHHRNVLIKVNSKSSHCANSVYRMLCVMCSAGTWVCANRGQNRTSGVFITFCLKKGSLTELEAHFCQAGCQASHIRLWSLNAGVTGPTQLFTWHGDGNSGPLLAKQVPLPTEPFPQFLYSILEMTKWRNWAN